MLMDDYTSKSFFYCKTGLKNKSMAENCLLSTCVWNGVTSWVPAVRFQPLLQSDLISIVDTQITTDVYRTSIVTSSGDLSSLYLYWTESPGQLVWSSSLSNVNYRKPVALRGSIRDFSKFGQDYRHWKSFIIDQPPYRLYWSSRFPQPDLCILLNIVLITCPVWHTVSSIFALAYCWGFANVKYWNICRDEKIGFCSFGRP